MVACFMPWRGPFRGEREPLFSPIQDHHLAFSGPSPVCKWSMAGTFVPPTTCPFETRGNYFVPARWEDLCPFVAQLTDSGANHNIRDCTPRGQRETKGEQAAFRIARANEGELGPTGNLCCKMRARGMSPQLTISPSTAAKVEGIEATQGAAIAKAT